MKNEIRDSDYKLFAESTRSTRREFTIIQGSHFDNTRIKLVAGSQS